MMKRSKPTQRQIDSLNGIIGRLSDWQYRFPDDFNEVESAKRELLAAVDRLERQRQGVGR